MAAGRLLPEDVQGAEGTCNDLYSLSPRLSRRAWGYPDRAAAAGAHFDIEPSRQPCISPSGGNTQQHSHAVPQHLRCEELNIPYSDNDFHFNKIRRLLRHQGQAARLHGTEGEHHCAFLSEPGR